MLMLMLILMLMLRLYSGIQESAGLAFDFNKDTETT